MSSDGMLLLGGGGFIGSALARRLRHEKLPAHILGQQDGAQLEGRLPHCGTVIHLASSTTPGLSATRPELELDNLALTLRLLDLLQKQPSTHLIYFSSGGAIYGNPIKLPVAEDSPLAPLSYHGGGKAAQEAFCQVLRASGHAVTIVRPSNAYGPGQTMKSGFGLVRTLLEHARHGTTLEIWGDGENVRDYIFIDDIIEACMGLIKLPQDSATYNLGSGVGYSINQVKGIVEEISGKKVQTIYRPARGMDVRAVVLDNTRLKERLQWQAGTDLADGVAKTWEWLRLE
jgi:UDP-glucose 4-epimerase